MKVLICGDRNWADSDFIRRHILTLPASTTIVTGGARGADELAWRAAKSLNMRCVVYQADWKTYGKAAGPIRNQRMLDCEHPDAVFAFHDDIDSSKGTKHMVTIARKQKIPTYILTHSLNPSQYPMNWFGASCDTE